MASKKTSNAGAGLDTFVTSYRHHKTGKIMRAQDYGLKAFHFFSKKSKKVRVSKDDPLIVSEKKETESGS